MRTALQAILADRPRLVAVGVSLRWLVWLAVGHPLWVLAAVFGWARGFGPIGGLVLAIAAETLLSCWAVLGLTPGADAIYMWQQACRFRRRFPAAFAKGYQDLRLLALAVGNIYSAPGGLRPVLSAPRLSVLPKAFSYRTVGWVLVPRAQHQATELESAMTRIAKADSRLAGLQIYPTRQGGMALIATFAPPAIGRSGLLSTQLSDLDDGPGGGPSSNPSGDKGTGQGDPFNTFLNLGDPADPWDSFFDTQGDDLAGPMVVGESPPRPGSHSARTGSMFIDRGRPQSPNEEETLMIIDADDYSDTYDFYNAAPPQIPFTASLIDGPPVDAPGFIDRTSTWPRTRVPMGWSLLVVAPVNLLAGLAVVTTDAGTVGIVALFAMAIVSLLLVVAEALSGS